MAVHGPDTPGDLQELTSAFSRVGPGEHLCRLHQGNVGRRQVATAFLRAGLARGERVLFLADEKSRRVVEENLAMAGVDVAAESARDALVLMEARDAYLQDGTFDPKAMVAFIESVRLASLESGFPAVRGVAEMDWAIGAGVDRVTLMRYEAMLNLYLAGREVTVLCQYDRSAFPPDTLRDVILTHPRVVVDGLIGRNPYYVPPEEYLSGVPVEVEVDRLLTNILERERAERDVQRAVRRVGDMERLAALGTLLAGVAHEIRTPMTYVANNLNLVRARLERTGLSGPELQRILASVDVALEGVSRIGDILDDLRSVYRSEAAEWRIGDLSDPVERALDLYEGAYLGDVRIERDLGSAPGVGFEEGQVVQVVVNLVANAVEATPKGGRVRVSTRHDDGRARLVVEDEGEGVRPEDRGRIYDPFFTRKRSGTGLGLFLVSRIVARHGGRIDLSSDVTSGTCFIVSLPVGLEGPLPIEDVTLGTPGEPRPHTRT
ncbi:MAG: MEDS domain-containing protein [Euryarchaeota archaeon]|nr:MEDS domain-containing protein [Euryarchaeota archaeon]